jgi:peptide methionine sulfoxide reductase msrA/msrB
MLLEIVFAAGCFWGVEKNFEQIDGVLDAVSGYAGGSFDNPTYYEVLKNRKSDGDDKVNHTEAVKIVYDSSIVETDFLIKNFWEIHNPTQVDGQGNDIGNNYRSAIYWTNQNQKTLAINTKNEFQSLLVENGYGDIVTEIRQLDRFWPAEQYHQDYLLKNPNGYCPDHSTGVKFNKKDKSIIEQEIITPLGGMEIIVIEDEDRNTCLYCLQFDKDVISKYKGSIPLRTTPVSALKGFNLTSPTWATPTIFFIRDGYEVWSRQGYMPPDEFYRSLGEFKLGKNSEAFDVAFNESTDARFCQQYEIFKNTPDGIFADKLSGRALFDTKDRFDSKSGWLSFTKPVEDEVYEKMDFGFGMIRTEIRSVSSDIHLGHVFNDGPDGKPRYCINATVLDFVADISSNSIESESDEYYPGKDDEVNGRFAE